LPHLLAIIGCTYPVTFLAQVVTDESAYPYVVINNKDMQRLISCICHR
jgi:hypothetical protein